MALLRHASAGDFWSDLVTSGGAVGEGRGHKDKVTCVDGSDAMEYIVTGSDDGTARVWHYDNQRYACYRLFATLEHNEKEEESNLLRAFNSRRTVDRTEFAVVTAVVFAGSSGPVVTATDRGHIRIWCLETGTITKQVEPEAITCVHAKRGVSGMDKLLLVHASGKKATLAEAHRVQDDSGQYLYSTVSTLVHESDVLRVQHVPGAITRGAALATCVSHNILLWNAQGVLCMTLRSHLCPIDCFRISPMSNKNIGWIVAGGRDKVSLWPLRNGYVIGSDNNPAPAFSYPRSLVQYDIPEGILDVSIDPDHEFIVVMRKDLAFEVTKVLPNDPNDAVGKKEPASLLVRHNMEVTLSQVRHTFPARAMCVYRHENWGQTLIAGFDNGTCQLWDLEGDDAGERIAKLCAMTWWEFYLRLGILLVSFFQVMSFAFGPATSWAEELKAPIKMERKIELLSWSWALSIDMELVFWPETYATISVMFSFLCLAVAGVPDKLWKLKRLIRKSDTYKTEKDLCCRPMHMCLSVVSATLRYIIAPFMGACSTILVVPIFKACANCFDCVHPLDGSLPFLAGAPRVVCYDQQHWILEGVVGTLAFLFFLVLIPYAVVLGDIDYVRPNTLCKWQVWKEAAERKATLKDYGCVHPLARTVFQTLVLELVAKIALPCVAILTTSRPLFQVVVVACIGAAMLVHSLVFPPAVDPFVCALMQGSKLLTFMAMLCGCLTVVMPDAHLSQIGLVCATAFTLVFIACQSQFKRTQEYEQINGELLVDRSDSRTLKPPRDPPSRTMIVQTADIA